MHNPLSHKPPPSLLSTHSACRASAERGNQRLTRRTHQAFMASFTVCMSPQLSFPSQHAAKSMGHYSGLKCCQLPKITLQTRRTPTIRPLRVSCQSTIEEVQDIIATKLSVDRASVQPQTKFSELGADSLDTVEIVMSLEEKFNISIGEEDAGNISTVQQVADLIEKQTISA